MNIINRFTLKYLAKNKTRTIVTIIGIILSVAMVTAVTTAISSLRTLIYDVIVADQGSWHGSVRDVEKSKFESVSKNDKVANCVYIQNIGYSSLKDSKNVNKPYLFIGGIQKNFTQSLPIHLISGKMPENDSEIILPEHLKTNGGIKYAIGDKITLDVSKRFWKSKVLNQHNEYVTPDEDPSYKETLVPLFKKTYTVTGFYKRPSFEYYSAPGYTALTLADSSFDSLYDIYITMKNPKEVYSFVESTFKDYTFTYNDDLLRVLGISNMKSFNSVLYGFGAILIGIIVFGSISLIYNAFSISVSERTKQFGLLSSVGATKKQIASSVYFEAFALCIIGIPLGILSGIAGIGVTFYFIKDIFARFIESADVALRLDVSWISVAAAAVIGLLTVFISAYIPSKRATRLSVIDAIRQSEDIKIKGKKVKTSKLTYLLFGFEGMLASKNFKRNKKKYRATVISLFVSVVLFISAGSFCDYLTTGSNAVIDSAEYDIAYQHPIDQKDVSVSGLYNDFMSIGDIDDGMYAYMLASDVGIPAQHIDDTYKKELIRTGSFTETEGEINSFAIVYFIQDDKYREFLKSNHLSDKFMSADNPVGIARDKGKAYDDENEKYISYNMLGTDNLDIALYNLTDIDGYKYQYTEATSKGERVYIYSNGRDEKRFTHSEIKNKYNLASTLHIGAVVDKLPFCVENAYGEVLTIVYPESAYKKVVGNDTGSNLYINVKYCFKAENHKAAYEKMSGMLEEKNLPSQALYDYSDSAEVTKALITVVNVFSYGFIILISLIALANVFNTISTNIILRRREFAMLKSVGMTQKGFYKMMNYECLLYGIKGLIFGLPVSFGVVYLIFTSLSQGLQMNFFIPWKIVLTAVGSVFAVVFATMIYSMRKIRSDNPIDAIKDENL